MAIIRCWQNLSNNFQCKNLDIFNTQRVIWIAFTFHSIDFNIKLGKNIWGKKIEHKVWENIQLKVSLCNLVTKQFFFCLNFWDSILGKLNTVWLNAEKYLISCLDFIVDNRVTSNNPWYFTNIIEYIQWFNTLQDITQVQAGYILKFIT